MLESDGDSEERENHFKDQPTSDPLATTEMESNKVSNLLKYS